MSELSGEIGSGASAPSSGAPPASAPSGATSEPASATATPAPGGPPSSPTTAGEPPRERWDAILRNAREKTNAEAEARFAWAKGLDPDRVRRAMGWYQRAEADPVRFHEWLTDRLRRDPMYARHVNADQGPSLPEPDYQAESGERFYSAKALTALLKAHADQLRGDLLKEIQPMQRQSAYERAERTARSDAQRQLGEAQEWPHFNDHRGDIRAAMLADKRLSLRGAYIKVVVPKLRQLERQAVVAEMKAKPTASTTNPAPGSTSPPTDFAKYRRGGRVDWRGAAEATARALGLNPTRG